MTLLLLQQGESPTEKSLRNLRQRVRCGNRSLCRKPLRVHRLNIPFPPPPLDVSSPVWPTDCTIVATVGPRWEVGGGRSTVRSHEQLDDRQCALTSSWGMMVRCLCTVDGGMCCNGVKTLLWLWFHESCRSYGTRRGRGEEEGRRGGAGGREFVCARIMEPFPRLNSNLVTSMNENVV